MDALFSICIATDSLCAAWLNDGLAQCECWNGVKLQWLT